MEQVFRRWFEKPEYDRYSAMLLNGLCKSSPEAYPSLLPRFLKISQDHPEYFEKNIVVREMVRVTTLPIVAAHLHQLDDEPLREFMGILRAEPPIASIPKDRLALIKPKTGEEFSCQPKTPLDERRLRQAFFIG